MTANKEDYLKTIFKLQVGNKWLANKAIAEDLGVSAAAVTEMLLKLRDEGFIEYQQYKGCMLNNKGKAFCSRLLKNHRLWEVFLVDHLKYSWNEAHDLAEKLEHCTDKLLSERLDKYLDYPCLSPHGEVVPREQYIRDKRNMCKLSTLSSGDKSFILKVDEDNELLRYVQNKGIEINMNFEVINIDSYDKSFTLKSGDRLFELSNKAAQHIYVNSEKFRRKNESF